MVKLSSVLPKEHDENGLFANSRHLLDIYTSGKYVPIVALVRTKEITSTEDYTRVPKIELVHVEGAFNENDADAVRSLLVSLHDDRVKHVKQPMDLPDVDDDEPTDGLLQLEASATADVVDAELVDDEGPTITDREDG